MSLWKSLLRSSGNAVREAEDFLRVLVHDHPADEAIGRTGEQVER
jgi:hypothetical protein